jgi:serine/threonine protein kinase
MTGDHNQIRLGDFGLARELAMNEYAKSYCGVSEIESLRCLKLTYLPQTETYLAPEVHNDEDYDSSADIFSLGAIIYELCTLK